MLGLREAIMKAKAILPVLALGFAAVVAAAPADARGPYRGSYVHAGHYHGGYGYRSRIVFGFNVGTPWGYPYAYPYAYPYYAPYYSAPYVIQQQPSVYVEQPQAQPAQPPAGYWYYCAETRAYYPYVKECAAGWERVAPQPQN